jgi:hypothetical protein
VTIADDVRTTTRATLERLDLSTVGRALNGLVGRVEAIYGKPISIKPLPEDQHLRATGLWVDFPDRGVVLYRESDPKPYQRFSILHELGHIGAGHTGCDLLPDEAVGPIASARTVRARVPRTDAPTDSISTQTFEELVAEETAYELLRWLISRPTNPAEDAFA